MPDIKKTGKWRAKFAAKKIEFAADAPPSKEAVTAFRSGIIGIAATVVAVAFALIFAAKLWLLALVIWLIGLPFTVRGILYGKFEGNVIAEGRAPSRGKPLTRNGLLLGLGAVAITVLYLVFLIVMALRPAPELPGKYGTPEKTFDLYVKAVQSGDFDAYLDCLSKETKSTLDKEQLQTVFESLKTALAQQKMEPQTPAYTGGGGTAKDAERADITITCTDRAKGAVTTASMTLTREEEGWKVVSTSF